MTPASAAGASVTSTPPAYSPPTYSEPMGPVVREKSSGAATSAGGTYTVQKGDTLIKIARTHYGDAHQWTKIAAANPGINANSIKVGQQIVLP